jgi:charged multivesicular body protein 4A/B
MGNIDSKEEKININETIEKNKNIVTTLNKRLNYLEKKIDKEKKNVKEKIRNNNKKLALINLKRKKMYEKQVDNLYSQICNIEQQIIMLEGSAINTSVINTMEISKNTLNRINKENNIEKVEQIIGNLEEQININEEVNEVLNTPINDVFDDTELLEELDNLIDDKKDVKKNFNLKNMPNVPNNKISFQKDINKEEKDALNELETLMQ